MLARGQQKNVKDALQTRAGTKLLAKSQEEGQVREKFRSVYKK